MKKTNKTFKRFAAITSASLLAACAMAPVFTSMTSYAADITINGTSSDTITGHTYKAYQIFTGTLSGEVLSNVNWGSGVNNTTILGAVQAITLDDDSEPFKDCTDAAGVAEILSGYGDNSEIVKAFAAVVGANLGTNSGSYNAETHKITGLSDGYFLVQDETEGQLTDSAKTRYLIDVAGSASVNIKSSYPEVMKKVQEESLMGGTAESTNFPGTTTMNPGDGYNDIADYDIGDDVPFMLYGSLPSTLADYECYYYCFNDTLGKEFKSPENFEVKIGTEVIPRTFNTNVNGLNKVYTNYTVETTKNENGTITTTIKFKDIKKLYLLNAGGVSEFNPTIDDVVTVSYTAELDTDAVIGRPGQINEVDLSYSNNPNQEYNPWDGTEETAETGKTTKDVVKVYTYELNIDKVNTEITEDTTQEQFEAAKLKGAKFILYKKVGTDFYAAVVENNIVTKWVKGAFNEEYTTFVKDQTETDDATELSSGGDEYSTIKIKGLDEGQYYMREVAAPAEYNNVEGEISLNIVATTTNIQDWDETKEALTSLTLNDKSALEKADALGRNGEEVDGVKNGIDTGLVWTSIVNKKGTSLPGTGGIGTTIFYLGGGAMAAIGGVYLISKRRMKKSEE